MIGKWTLRTVGGFDHRSGVRTIDPTLEKGATMSSDGGTRGFADRLRAARRSCGYTQEKLARLADVGVGTVRDLEQGRRLPGLLVIGALAHALGYTVTELTGE